jgi:hypothetical protein
MTTRMRDRLVTVPLAIGASVVLATAAYASSTISIKSSQGPVRASEFGEHDDCAFPDLPSRTPPVYGWHFVLPGGTATFDSLTAHFASAGDVTLPGPDGGFVQGGKGAVIYTVTDDTLTSAVATIEGSTPQGYFVLSHSCLPASATPSASVSATATETPSASASETALPSESVSATATETPSAEVSGTELSRTPSSSESGSPSESVSPSVLGEKFTNGGGTGLPSTGLSALGLLAIGGALIGYGRRADPSAEGPLCPLTARDAHSGPGG